VNTQASSSPKLNTSSRTDVVYVMPGSEPGSPARSSIWFSDVAVLIYMTAAVFIVHLLFGKRYGFHPDELATLDDSRHLAWGYPAYPPLTPFLGRVSLILFGVSPLSFRVFAALAADLPILLTGLMARELGARRGAQMLAAIAAVPWCLLGGTAMKYSSFDYLFWVLAAYFVIRLLKSEDPRWWIAIGASIGLGLMAKYTMFFFATGLIVSLLGTRARRYFLTRHFWYGVAVALLIFLPNLIWQIRHDFVSLAFLRFIHERDVSSGRTLRFLRDQWQLTLFALPLWATGIWFYLFARKAALFRMVAVMYVVPLVLFLFAKSRGYYLLPAYPMLYAAGSVWGEQALASLGRGIWATLGRVAARALAWAALALNIAIACLVLVPVAPLHSKWGRTALVLNEDFREELGWPELVETVARIRDSMPEPARPRLGVLAMNYGEAGALSLYGPQYGLPRVISGVDSFWQRGYGDPAPEALIIVGATREFVDSRFAGCQVRARTWNRYRVPNRETQDHPDIFVCQGLLHQSWPEFWKSFQYFE
jgi:Dolichyl-phosphate-mannose-protein mannosyltransferase